MDGLKVAAFYSLPSYSLGFCGPQDTISRKNLAGFVSGENSSKREVRRIFEKFEAAYQYYKLIAKKNRIRDPLDDRVVRAFWVGNELLEKVTEEDIRKLILTDFCRSGLLTKLQAKEKANQVPKGAMPHHSFHVLVLGAITGRVDLKGAMLDLCRIGWGRVEELEGSKDKLRVAYKPLVLGKDIRLGEEIKKTVSWDNRIIPKVELGEWVSFHWGETCEILDVKSVANLEKYTKNTIDSLNAQNR